MESTTLLDNLFHEHTIISRALAGMREMIAQSDAGETLDVGRVGDAADFMAVFADELHHGKEEQILFPGLLKKALNAEDRQVMDALAKEHDYARNLVIDLSAALKGSDAPDRKHLRDLLYKLVMLYEKHILLENETFFPAAATYLTPKDHAVMGAMAATFERDTLYDRFQNQADRIHG